MKFLRDYPTATNHLRPRVASSTSTSARKTSTIKQPTAVVPLTTTFTPAPTCTAGIFSILPPPGYFFWANEPVPAANHTSSDCYPREFMESYTSVTSGTVGSSVVPALSPLACPKSFCTVFAGDNNYLACCPSGYQFHAPDTTVDSNRPGYGGTCYSDVTMSSTYTVVAYDTDGGSKTQLFIASTTGTQVYAHPMDGFAQTPAAIGCDDQAATLSANSTTSLSETKTSSGTSSVVYSTSLPTQSSDRTDGHSLSKGSIAGAVIGGLVGLAILFALAALLLRRRTLKKPQQLPDLSNKVPLAEMHVPPYEIPAGPPPQPVYEVEANETKAGNYMRLDAKGKK